MLISTLSPAGGSAIVKSLIKDYFRRKSFEKYQFLKDLKSLQKRELIDYKELNDGRVKITMTKKGKEKILIYNLDSMELKKPARWDRKWRIIIFDIPEDMKRAREAIRKKLKDLNFYPLQKSVFITPYSCEDEIDFIASIFNIRKYILILYVSHFEGEEKFKHYFKIWN